MDQSCIGALEAVFLVRIFVRRIPTHLRR
jgi:hypothetical protein